MSNQENYPTAITDDIKSASVKNVCCGIYGLQNKLKPEKWYVGASKDIFTRWRDYRKKWCKKQPKLYHALKKYGYENFEKVILEECSTENLKDRENYWTKNKNAVENGYNCGYINYGEISEEKLKKKNAHLKRIWTPELRAIASLRTKAYWATLPSKEERAQEKIKKRVSKMSKHAKRIFDYWTPRKREEARRKEASRIAEK